MSSFDSPPTNMSPEPQQRSGCVTAVMLVVGIILLLPGLLCVVLNITLGGSGNDPITGLVVLVALGGLGLIVFAVTRR